MPMCPVTTETAKWPWARFDGDSSLLKYYRSPNSTASLDIKAYSEELGLPEKET